MAQTVDITQEKISDLNTLVKINLKKEDYQPQFEASIKEHSKKVQLKGFRPGKVPNGIVKKMYGPQILFDELNKILSEELDTFIKTNDLEILGNPLPQRDENLELDANDLKDYEFTYELGLTPKFELAYLEKTPTFEKPAIKIEESAIDEEVDRIRKRLGTSSNPDDIEKDDVLYCKIEELDDDGKVKEDGIQNTTAVPLNMVKDKKMAAKILKMKKADQFDADIFQLMEKDSKEIAQYILNVEEDVLKSAGKTYKFSIENINRLEAADLNKEFFDKVYGPDVVKTEEELREKIKEELSGYYEQQAEQKLLKNIFDGLIENTEITLPDDFLKRWVKTTNEEPVTEEQVENDYPAFSKNLKWSLIVNKVARENDIKVESEELQDQARAIVSNQMAQYGYADIPEEQLNSFAANLLQDEKQIRSINDSILEKKIFDYLKSKIEVKEKEMSAEDFLKN